MATPQFLYSPFYPVEAFIATAQAVTVGDLCGLVGGTLKVAADTTWNNDLLTTQEDFASTFLGASAQTKAANLARILGNSDDNIVRVDTAGEWEYDCVSATYGVGQKMGAAKASGNALLSDKLAAVTATNAAVAVCVQRKVSATRIRVRLLSNLCPLARPMY